MAKKKAVSKITAQQWIDSMQDPDEVGASEYRVIHEFMTEVNSIFEDEPHPNEDSKLDRLDCCLDELSGWVDSIKKNLAEKREQGLPKTDDDE